VIEMRNVTAVVFSLAVLMTPQAYAADGGGLNGIRRVLLISIDGMHALDYENCAAGGTCPNLAALGKNGVTYTRTSTSKPSVRFLD